MTNHPANKMFYLFFVALGLMMFSSCQSHFFDNTKTVPNGQWAYQDSIVFEFDIQDKSKKYNVFLEVEHSKEYRFANLYTMLHITFPSGKKRNEQVSLELANTVGEWQGTCSGNNCTRKLPFMPNAVFEESGKHRIVLEQYNRTEPMAGINSFRLYIEEVKTQ